jgi:hypothetical protein
MNSERIIGPFQRGIELIRNPARCKCDILIRPHRTDIDDCALRPDHEVLRDLLRDEESCLVEVVILVIVCGCITATFPYVGPLYRVDWRTSTGRGC